MEWVVNQQKLKDSLAIAVDRRGIRVNDHAVARGQGAASLRLWHFAHGAIRLFEPDFHQAHAAHPDGFHARVVAENGDFQAKALNRFDDEFSSRDLEFDFVNRNRDGLRAHNGGHRFSKHTSNQVPPGNLSPV